MARPIVKWVGGKTRLLPEITARLPREYGCYYEPFAGGAAVFFHLAPERAVVSDVNADLMSTYRVVAEDSEAVLRRLACYRDNHDEHLYYNTRTRWNDRSITWSPVERAAVFLYLNRTCFNGLWRVNRQGDFNVPMGRYKNPPICAAEDLRAASSALRRAHLRCADYRTAVADAAPGDLVYFDPPYDPVTTTANFRGYTKDSFGPYDQSLLAASARQMAERGVAIVISNSDTPAVRKLYAGFRIDRVRAPRAINSDATKRGAVDELIIMGGFDCPYPVRMAEVVP